MPVLVSVSCARMLISWLLVVQQQLTNECTIVLFRFYPSVEPWKPMVFLSICTAMTPTLIKSAIPLAVPRSVIGTAFGVYALFESFGGTVGHLLFGYLREVMSSYSEDLDTLIGMCIAALVVTLIVMAANNGDRRI